MQTIKLANTVRLIASCPERRQYTQLINPDTGHTDRGWGNYVPIPGSSLRLEGYDLDVGIIDQWIGGPWLRATKAPGHNMHRSHDEGRGYVVNVDPACRIMVARRLDMVYLYLALKRDFDPGAEALAIEVRAPGYYDQLKRRWFRPREYGDYRMIEQTDINIQFCHVDGTPIR